MDLNPELLIKMQHEWNISYRKDISDSSAWIPNT
jgi:hypothetical protein